MNSLHISLYTVLQDISDEEDKCVDRMIGSLKKRNGITAVKVTEDQKSQPQLLIKFDVDIISENQIRQIVQKIGKKLDKTFGHLRIKVQEIQDTQRIQATTALLKNLKGVMNVLVVPTGWIMLEFNKYITEESLLLDCIEKIDLVV